MPQIEKWFLIRGNILYCLLFSFSPFHRLVRFDYFILSSVLPQESSEDSKRKINEMTSAIEELRNILKETDDGKTFRLSSRYVYFFRFVYFHHIVLSSSLQ